MAWDIKTILPVLLSITPLQRLSVYLATEVFVVLVIIAATLIVALLPVIVFLLFSEGARLGFSWLRAKVLRIAGLRHDQFAHQEAVANPSPRQG